MRTTQIFVITIVRVVVVLPIYLIPVLLLPTFIFLSYLLNSRQINQTLAVLLLVGALGWLVAFFRIIPLQIVQLIILSILGADIGNEDSIATYEAEFAVIIWGPLFAGLFEGLFRYYFISRYKTYFRENRLRHPIIFGLGWSSGEIMVLYMLQLLTASGDDLAVSGFILLAAGIERISATIVHVSLSLIVVYALFEIDNRISLYLIMTLHFLFDFIIIIWILQFDHLDTTTYIWTIELALFTTAIIYLIFALKFWRPLREVELHHRQKISSPQDTSKYL